MRVPSFGLCFYFLDSLISDCCLISKHKAKKDVFETKQCKHLNNLPILFEFPFSFLLSFSSRFFLGGKFPNKKNVWMEWMLPAFPSVVRADSAIFNPRN